MNLYRAFYLHYDSETSVEGIPAYTFKMDDDTYDSTTQKNKGYRYENKEMIDYFPSWPCGVNHSYDPSQDFCIDVDCDVNENFCSTCCDGSHIHGENDTILLPPGVIPLRCFPGSLFQWIESNNKFRTASTATHFCLSITASLCLVASRSSAECLWPESRSKWEASSRKLRY